MYIGSNLQLLKRFSFSAADGGILLVHYVCDWALKIVCNIISITTNTQLAGGGCW